jgi:diadenylate cyclase
MDLFSLGFMTVTIWDVVDVLIVGFLFYRLYVVMRGTIAAQIFVGLLVVLLFSFVAQATNLRALGWILHALTDVWVIALVVLFQPELRRLLLLIGRNPIVNRIIRLDFATALDAAVDASRELAMRRHGALIVMIRTTGLGLFTEAGVQLHAQVSKELLVSLFNPTSPLHDGAVIIKDRVLESARCTLPLSATERLGGAVLGTRHRAALGISEQADVIVIVVSEETGAISIAEDGVMTRNVTVDALRQRLRTVFGVQQGRRRRLFGLAPARAAKGGNAWR